ncbi:MAG: homoserine kinase [Acidobacteria bacterium]|nr:homoserine kinase [Acidobacteriota bacterium]
MPGLNLHLPATSANLGPAFDAAALALDLSLQISADKAREYTITAAGRDRDICGRIENHLILTTYQEVLASEGKPAPPLALRIQNGFPVGKGCGSSAAARLAGIALAVRFGRLRWTSARIVGEASRREHHSDNAAACWKGGVTVSRMSGSGDAELVRFMPRGKWPLLLAIPEESLPTEAARKVLPGHYPREDAVANIQNSMLLLAALFQGDSALVASALEDHIHEPYRAPMCPLLPALREFPRGRGVIGAVLSGAGPSVLMFLDAEVPPEKTKGRVRKYLEDRQMKAELVLTSIARHGAETGFFRN